MAGIVVKQDLSDDRHSKLLGECFLVAAASIVFAVVNYLYDFTGLCPSHDGRLGFRRPFLSPLLLEKLLHVVYRHQIDDETGIVNVDINGKSMERRIRICDSANTWLNSVVCLDESRICITACRKDQADSRPFLHGLLVMDVRTGEIVQRWGQQILRKPMHLARDAVTGRLAVCDTDRVTLFRPDGTLLTHALLPDPISVAFDKQGQVCVLDMSQLHVFRIF